MIFVLKSDFWLDTTEVFRPSFSEACMMASAIASSLLFHWNQIRIGSHSSFVLGCVWPASTPSLCRHKLYCRCQVLPSRCASSLWHIFLQWPLSVIIPSASWYFVSVVPYLHHVVYAPMSASAFKASLLPKHISSASFAIVSHSSMPKSPSLSATSISPVPEKAKTCCEFLDVMKVEVKIVSRGIEADKRALRDVWRREGRSASIYHVSASNLTRPKLRVSYRAWICLKV